MVFFAIKVLFFAELDERILIVILTQNGLGLVLLHGRIAGGKIKADEPPNFYIWQYAAAHEVMHVPQAAAVIFGNFGFVQPLDCQRCMCEGQILFVFHSQFNVVSLFVGADPSCRDQRSVYY